MKSWVGIVVTLLVAFPSLVEAQTSPSAPQPENAKVLFSDPGTAIGREVDTSADPGIRRARFVTVNLPESGASRASMARPDMAALRLQLFDDRSFTALVDEVRQNELGSESWIGHIDGVADSLVILVMQDGVVAGNVSVAGESYKIRHAGDDLHVIAEVDGSLYPPEDEPIPVESSFFVPQDALPATASDDGTVFDLMVVYTATARSAAGGQSGMESVIQLGVTETNLAYQNSNILPRLRLVHTREVGYTETGSSTDLSRLANPADGYMDEVHVLRDIYGADLVKLVTNDAGFCGIAYLMCGNDPDFDCVCL